MWLYRVPDGPPQVVSPYWVPDEQGGPRVCEVQDKILMELADYLCLLKLLILMML